MHHQDHNLRSQNWLNDHKLLPIGYVSGFRPRRGRLNRRNKSRNSNYHLFLKGAFEGLYRGTVLIINVEYIQVLFDLIREKWTISRPLCLLYEWIFYFRSAYHSTRYFICRCQTPVSGGLSNTPRVLCLTGCLLRQSIPGLASNKKKSNRALIIRTPTLPAIAPGRLSVNCHVFARKTVPPWFWLKILQTWTKIGF